ncbi:MAG: hypothetical protein KDA93_08955 [Planctomycetaceae bacterium]|nr:hypothetical protein [Planctomycetaceae bacterium]
MVAFGLLSNRGFAVDAPATATIEQTRWGFDNKFVPHTFVPLSVLVRNDSPNDFEGKLRLTRSLRVNKQVDAFVEQDVYLGPLSSRWVQLTPYAIGEWEEWQLTWDGADDDPYTLPSLNEGDRATVLIYDPDRLQTAGGILNRFPADLFPTSVTAMDGLRGVVLDHSPRWQGARRQAFWDWLRLGGRVYLLHNEQGEFPRFDDSLSVLNRATERFQVGSGTVRRIPRTVASIDPQSANDLILHDEESRFNSPAWQKRRATPGYPGAMPLINRSGWDRDSELLNSLQALSRFERNWWVIYGLAMLYVLALFPGCYLLGRRLKTHVWFYVGFLSFVGLFSVGFVSLGRIGASHTARIRGVVLASELEDGMYNVMGWSSAAARVAGDYRIEHKGTGRLYTAASELEPVEGQIVNGADGHLVARMPPASTRSVIHRTRQDGPSLGVHVKRVTFDAGQLTEFAIGTGEKFPTKPLSVHLWSADWIYEMEQKAGEWQLKPSSRKQGISFLAAASEIRPLGFRLTVKGPTWLQPELPPLIEEFEELTRSLIANSFGLDSTVDPLLMSLRPGRVRLFVYAEMPPEFATTGESFPDQFGCVMYVIDLPTSPTSPAGPRVTPEEKE